MADRIRNDREAAFALRDTARVPDLHSYCQQRQREQRRESARITFVSSCLAYLIGIATAYFVWGAPL